MVHRHANGTWLAGSTPRPRGGRTRALTTKHEESPLLALPAELRLMTYDYLLSDLVGCSLEEEYKLLPDLLWGDKGITIFLNLSQVCRIIRQEFRYHFEQKHLQNVMLYFDESVRLHQAVQLATVLGTEYRNMRFTFINYTHNLDFSESVLPWYQDVGSICQVLRHKVDMSRICDSHLTQVWPWSNASDTGEERCTRCPNRIAAIFPVAGNDKMRLNISGAVATKTTDGVANRIMWLEKNRSRFNGFDRSFRYNVYFGRLRDLDEHDFSNARRSKLPFSSSERRARERIRGKICEALQSGE